MAGSAGRPGCWLNGGGEGAVEVREVNKENGRRLYQKMLAHTLD